MERIGIKVNQQIRKSDLKPIYDLLNETIVRLYNIFNWINVKRIKRITVENFKNFYYITFIILKNENNKKMVKEIIDTTFKGYLVYEYIF